MTENLILGVMCLIAVFLGCLLAVSLTRIDADKAIELAKIAAECKK